MKGFQKWSGVDQSEVSKTRRGQFVTKSNSIPFHSIEKGTVVSGDGGNGDFPSSRLARNSIVDGRFLYANEANVITKYIGCSNT